MIINNNSIELLPKPEPGYDPIFDQRIIDIRSNENKKEKDFPKISIVTPSFNQGKFIERTIRCILLQGYPNLEYIIIDGGSTDNSIEIIKKYEPWLAYWVSEPDTGMYNALNKGFKRSSGEIMGWSPTGDLYETNALNIIGSVFGQFPQVEWLTSLFKIKSDESGNEIAKYQINGFSKEYFFKGLNFTGGNPFARYMIQQQSTFWRRSLWERTGEIMNDAMKGAGDFDLWARFFSKDAILYAIDQPIGIFMSHEGQESVGNASRMYEEQKAAFESIGGKHIGYFEKMVRSFIFHRVPTNYSRALSGFLTFHINMDNKNDKLILKKSYFI